MSSLCVPTRFWSFNSIAGRGDFLATINEENSLDALHQGLDDDAELAQEAEANIVTGDDLLPTLNQEISWDGPQPQTIDSAESRDDTSMRESEAHKSSWSLFPQLCNRTTALPTICEEASWHGQQRLTLYDAKSANVETNHKTSMRKSQAHETSGSLLPHRFDLTTAMMASSLVSKVDVTNPYCSLRVDKNKTPVRPSREGDETYPEMARTDTPVETQRMQATETVKWSPGRRLRGARATNMAMRPAVWDIEPGINSDGSIRFKFSTTGGACLILTHDEAFETVKVIAEESDQAISFKFHSDDRSESTIVPKEAIFQILHDISRGCGPPLDKRSIFSVTTVTSRSPGSKATREPWQRLIRGIRHRRWKNGIRRRVRAATVDTAPEGTTRPRGRFLPFPIRWGGMFFPRKEHSS
jgi:hypothetical protein